MQLRTHGVRGPEPTRRARRAQAEPMVMRASKAGGEVPQAAGGLGRRPFHGGRP